MVARLRSRWPRRWSHAGCSGRYSTPSRRSGRCCRHDVEEWRHGWPTGLSTGEVRPDLRCEGRMPVQSLITSRVTRVPGAVVMPPILLNARTEGVAYARAIDAPGVWEMSG
jgi:hypothetical protein